MPADELLTDRGLDVITNDSDLDLPTPIGVSGPTVRPGDAHVARRVDLAPHRHHRHGRPHSHGFTATRSTLDTCLLFGRVVTAGVRRDQHTAVVEVHEPAIADHLDFLAGEPHASLVVGCGEADRALAAHAPGRRWRHPRGGISRRSDGVSTAERAELVELRRELRVAKLEVEILKRAAAYFARENMLPN